MRDTWGVKLRVASVCLAVVALGACASEGLEVINLSGASNTGADSKLAAQESCLPGVEGGCSDAMYMPTEFVYAAGVTEWPELGGSQPSWRLKKHKATDADLVRIADVFGVSGGIASFSYDKNSRYIGAEDYSKPTVTTYYDGIASSWNYSASTDMSKSSRSEPNVGSSHSSSSSNDSSTTLPEQPKPPTNVPNKRQAADLSEEFMKKLVVETGDLKVDVYADEWGASVTYNELIDGVPGLRYWIFTYGGEQELQYASGPLSGVVSGPSYPTVSVEEAFKRLSDSRFGVFPAEYMRANSADLAKSAGSTVSGWSEYAPTTDTTTADEPKVITFTLTGARRSVTGIYMEKYGNIMMPAYMFTNEQGDVVRVIAVEDKFLSFEPTPLPEPLPSDSVVGAPEPMPIDETTNATDFTAIPQNEADVLIGLTEDEASKVAIGRGWTMRVASVDGKDNMLTADYSYTRVNVVIVNGVVTAVAIG